ncbi:hypothetical protein GFH48_22265 [Streptomyces fagopyri]|uniref:Uncharacterized protein n=1 Tax=Streptomyces fagopyri TaxID=2662397 RepID=A0A5Q0LEV6_9ACTN|nr:hypothetical protein [Streptomyces fagopyri]QFZ75625.1 hypothetical protein GFH48_22265 [Streptomyces fagopyri]
MAEAAPEGARGVLLRGAPGGESWAYIAFSLSPVPLPGGLYPEFSEARRRADRVAAERTWLAALWTDRTTARWDLRFISDPASGRIETVVIAQLYGADPAAAVRAARDALPTLARLPAHVTGVRIEDTAEIARVLAPFVPGWGAIAEIRKRITCRTLTRLWGAERIATAVSRFDARDPSWERIWSQLAAEPRRTVVSVCLEPCSAPAGLAESLTMRAQAFGTLAAPGPPDPLYGGPVPGDPFAREAHALYDAASRRYTGRLHRARISVAVEGEAPVSDVLTGLIGHTVAPAGSGAVAVRPGSGEEHQVACGNLLGVNRDWQREAYWQEVPAFLRAPSRGQLWLSDPGTVTALADLVDADEAAAVFRLPHEEPGDPELFALSRRQPDTRPDGASAGDAGTGPGTGTGTGAGTGWADWADLGPGG